MKLSDHVRCIIVIVIMMIKITITVTTIIIIVNDIKKSGVLLKSIYKVNETY